MRRREFLGVLGGAAAAWPLAARAQRSALPVIGFLRSTSLVRRSGSRDQVSGRPDGSGFHRWPERHGRVSFGGRTTRSVAGAGGRTGPEAGGCDRRERPGGANGQGRNHDGADRVRSGGDPIKLGLVTSVNRPGGNVTGVNFLLGVLGAKRLDLLRQFVPKTATIGFLVNPNTDETEAERSDVEAAARTCRAANHHDRRKQRLATSRLPSRRSLDARLARCGRSGPHTSVRAPGTHRGASSSPCPSGDLHRARGGRGRWSDELRAEPRRMPIVRPAR